MMTVQEDILRFTMPGDPYFDIIRLVYNDDIHFQIYMIPGSYEKITRKCSN